MSFNPTLENVLDAGAKFISDIQARLASVAPDFMDGNLGIVYGGLQCLPSTNKESMLAFFGDFSVGGGQNSSGTYTYVPAIGNKPGVFSIGPVGNSNCYLWADLPLPKKPVVRLRDIRVLAMSIGSQSACQALEWETQISQNGVTNNCALQMAFKEGNVIRYFDFLAKVWKPTTVPVPDFSQGPVTIQGDFRLAADSTTHESITITLPSKEPIKYPLNITQPVGPGGSKMTTAWQLDGRNGLPTGISIYGHTVIGAFS